MKTAIIIVNYNTPWYLNLCLRSVFKNTSHNDFHIFLVHNSQDKKSYAVGEKFLKKYPENLTIIKSKENVGLVEGIALAYDGAIKCDYICLLNSDTIVSQGWLASLTNELAANPAISMIVPDSNCYYPENLSWKIIKSLPYGLSKLQLLQLIKPAKNKVIRGFEANKFFIDFGGGFCSVFRSEHIKKRGYILDRNIAHGYWDDLELTMYLRSFGEIGSTHKSYVYHFTNATFKLLAKKNNSLKKSMSNYNGYYVFKKYKAELLKGLQSYPIDQLESLSQNPYVAKFLEYLALSTVPGFDEFVDTLPAHEIWHKMRNN